MKTPGLSTLTRNIFLTITAVMMIFSFSSCAVKANFLNSSVVPAAQGSVKVKGDANKNYHIAIQISNLAPCERLQPPKKTYVIWMETDENITKNIGQINSTTNFLSNKLKASFETVSSSKPTKIFLTAEDDGSLQYPFSEVVLTTKDF